MALYLPGKTKCPLCGRVIDQDDEKVLLPPFISSDLDELWVFSDGVFHLRCFSSHPLANKARLRLREVLKRNWAEKKVCAVCQKEILKPDEYVTLGHLTDDSTNNLYQYNYWQFHRDCLPVWKNRQVLVDEIKKLKDTAANENIRLDWLLALLQASDLPNR